MSSSSVITDILEYANTWDVYGLSILYLHIFGHFSRFFSLSQPFITGFIMELTRNINPEPSKRSSLECLLKNTNKLFNNEKDWSFINKLDLSQINDFYDSLQG